MATTTVTDTYGENEVSGKRLFAEGDTVHGREQAEIDPAMHRDLDPHTSMCKIACKHFTGWQEMATNLALDDALIEDAVEIGGHRTKKAAVTAALLEYVERHRQRRVLDSFGCID